MLITHYARENYGMLSENLRLGSYAAAKQFALNHARDMNLRVVPSSVSS